MNVYIAIGLLLAVIGQTSGLERCDPGVCRLPTCYCGGREVPGGLNPSDTPQFVILTFDDAINGEHLEFYNNLFKNTRRNPNGCPIKATFYVSHKWTDYSMVQNLYSDGHEFASHTVSHPPENELKNFDFYNWTKEIIGQADLLHKYGGVKIEDIKGMRAPFLQIGGDNMFDALERYGFYYDSSISTLQPSWPFTLEYGMEHPCPVPPCAEKSHPGIWEIPLTRLQCDSGHFAMGDRCFPPREDETHGSIQVTLAKEFNRIKQYKTPFPLFWHAAWMVGNNKVQFPHRGEAFISFIDRILKRKDVYFVTNQQLLKWMRNPQTLKQLEENPEFFGCDFTDRPQKCNDFNTHQCTHIFQGDQVWWKTCQGRCPSKYPWVNDFDV